MAQAIVIVEKAKETMTEIFATFGAGSAGAGERKGASAGAGGEEVKQRVLGRLDEWDMCAISSSKYCIILPVEKNM